MSSEWEPPHSKETEMMVLGCMLSSDDAMKLSVSSLTSSDFYYQEHKLIFRALCQLHQTAKKGEIYLAAEELRKTSHLESAGGVAYLAALVQFVGTSANIHDYISLLMNQSLHRQAFQLLEEGKRELFKDPSGPAVSIERTRHKLTDLGRRFSPTEKTSIGEILSGQKTKEPSLIDKIEERRRYFQHNNKPYMAALPTGFAELDKQTQILEETNLVIVAARPSMGKTAFAINIANHICVDQKKPVALFSLEMGADQLASRFLSLRTAIPGERIKRGDLTDSELWRLKEEEEILRSAKLFIQDKNCSTVSQILATASRLKEEEGVALFIIDYLQLLSVTGGSESRQYEVAEISRKLKLLTLELKTPVLCISQLSRKVEERQGHRPMMSDLRDSGQIEQDSDVVLFIQRREYYEPTEAPGHAELIVAKNRNGSAIPSCLLHFDGACGKFSSIERSAPALPPPPAPTRVKTTRHLRSERYVQPDFHPLLR